MYTPVVTLLRPWGRLCLPHGLLHFKTQAIPSCPAERTGLNQQRLRNMQKIMAINENSMVQKDVDPIKASITLTVSEKYEARTVSAKAMKTAAAISIIGEYLFKLRHVWLIWHLSGVIRRIYPHRAFMTAVAINITTAKNRAYGSIWRTNRTGPKNQSSALAAPNNIPRTINAALDTHPFSPHIITPPLTAYRSSSIINICGTVEKGQYRLGILPPVTERPFGTSNGMTGM